MEFYAHVRKNDDGTWAEHHRLYDHLVGTATRALGAVRKSIHRCRWYNRSHVKLSLGGNSPVEYRASLGVAA